MVKCAKSSAFFSVPCLFSSLYLPRIIPHLHNCLRPHLHNCLRRHLHNCLRPHLHDCLRVDLHFVNVNDVVVVVALMVGTFSYSAFAISATFAYSCEVSEGTKFIAYYSNDMDHG